LKIIYYHRKYFEASAWSVLAIDRFKKAKEEGRDMGIAAGTALQSCKLFKEMANTIQAIPPEYSANYTKKCGDATKMSDMAIEKAKNVFFEKIPDFTAIPMPD